MLYIENIHTAKLEGEVVRLVRCEHCQEQYVYVMTVWAEGQASSPYFLNESGARRSAKIRAVDAFESQLRTASLPVPCPSCLNYQAHMIGPMQSEAIGKRMSSGMVFLLLFGLIGAAFGVAYLATDLFVLCAIMAIILGIGLPLAVLRFAQSIAYRIRFDPNSGPEQDRRAVAEQLACPRAEFEEAVRSANRERFAESVADEFDRRCSGEVRFEFPFWVDTQQLDDRQCFAVELPTGKTLRIDLDPDFEDGEEFEYILNSGPRTVEFICVLRVYTRTRHGRG